MLVGRIYQLIESDKEKLLMSLMIIVNGLLIICQRQKMSYIIRLFGEKRSFWNCPSFLIYNILVFSAGVKPGSTKAYTILDLIRGHVLIRMGGQWLGGRVLDSSPSGRGFEPHRRGVTALWSLSMTHLS